MDKKRLIIIAIVVGIIILIAGLVYWLFFTNQQPPTDNVVTQPPVSNRLVVDDSKNEAATVTKDTAVTLTAQEQTEITLERLAFSFAERFGSYSSSSDFENLRDLESLMTDNMKNWVDNLIAASRPSDGLPWGITTTALSLESSVVTDQDATFVIATQRVENRLGQTGPKIYKQNIELKMIKFADKWLVDQVTWQ